MYERFLELCGFEPEEIKREGPRVERAFEHWGIGSEDINRGEDRIRKFYDFQLIGVRKIIGIWLKEFADLTLAKQDGKKVIYSSFPPVSPLIGAMSTLSEKIYCCCPEVVTAVVMGQLFEKIHPILEKAEKFWLPPGQGHCSFLLTRFAIINEGMVPMPDLLSPAGTTCDQAPVTDEIIGQLHGVPVVVVESLNDESGEHYPYSSARRVRYVAQEIKNAAETFQRVIGQEFTEATQEQGSQAYGKLLSLCNQIQELRRADPLPLGAKDLALIRDLVGSCSRRGVEEGPAAAEILLGEMKQRIGQAIGVAEKGAPRVAADAPHLSNPAMTDVFEKAGLVLIASSLDIGKLISFPSEYGSAWERAADTSIRSPSRYCASGSIAFYRSICQEWNVDGLILNPLVKCRFHCAPAIKVKQTLEKELGIPALLFEYDAIDTRDYTPEYVRSRVEPFAEILKERKRLEKSGG